MKTEGSEGFNRRPVLILARSLALSLAVITLGGCSAAQQREITAAYISAQQEKAKAVIACATRVKGVATCGLMVAAAYGGGGTDAVPVVRSDLDVVLNSSVIGTGINAGSQIVQSNNAAKVAIAQTEAGVEIARSGDARQVETIRASANSNAAIAAAGFGSVGSVATTGLTALATAATSANNAGASNVSALANMVTKLPPTIQAGGSVTQAGGAVDQSTNGANRVTGNNNETARNILCTATGGDASASFAGFTASTAGATSALNPTYNPVVSVIPARTSNNCGNG